MLIKESFDNSLSREKGVALSEYGHIAYTLQTGMQSISESGELTRENLTILARQAADVSPCGGRRWERESRCAVRRGGGNALLYASRHAHSGG